MVDLKWQDQHCNLSLDQADLEIQAGDFHNFGIFQRKLFVSSDIEIVKSHERGYAKTKNPIFVWRTIDYCLTPYNLRHADTLSTFAWMNDKLSKELALGEADAEFAKNVREALAESSCNESVLFLPHWCQSYLRSVAQNVLNFPSNKRGQLDAKSAVKKLARGLGFVRPGWNAYSNFISSFETRMVWRKYRAMTESGQGASAARKALLDKYGLGDERSLFRILAKGRELSTDQT
jgi:hypothetical protein